MQDEVRNIVLKRFGCRPCRAFWYLGRTTIEANANKNTMSDTYIFTRFVKAVCSHVESLCLCCCLAGCFGCGVVVVLFFCELHTILLYRAALTNHCYRFGVLAHVSYWPAFVDIVCRVVFSMVDCIGL